MSLLMTRMVASPLATTSPKRPRAFTTKTNTCQNRHIITSTRSGWPSLEKSTRHNTRSRQILHILLRSLRTERHRRQPLQDHCQLQDLSLRHNNPNSSNNSSMTSTHLVKNLTSGCVLAREEITAPLCRGQRLTSNLQCTINLSFNNTNSLSFPITTSKAPLREVIPDSIHKLTIRQL